MSDQKEEDKMPENFPQEKHQKQPIDPIREKATRVQVKEGVILLDRNNPLHRLWDEDDE